MRRASLLAALLLAACGSGEEAGGNDVTRSIEEGEVATERLPSAPDNLQDDQRNEVIPLDPPPPSPDPSPATLTAFPASFQGRWGLVPNDCVPGRSDNKGLMEIGPNSLRFYESRGTATELLQPRPGRVEADLAFTGEGMEWTRVNALTLLSDGKTLVREERDPGASFRYFKCPDRT